MTAWPLDNTEYTAEAIGAWSGTRTRGVFSAEDCFAVTATGGFGIKVSPGLAWLKAAKWWGIAVLESSDTAFTVDVGSGLLPRYVAVVLQYDKATNTTQLVLKYGEYGSPAVKPQPLRNDSYDEVILASILQPAAAVEITQADITDERLNEDLCGVMRDGVTGIPTAELYSQWDAFFAQMQQDTADKQQKAFEAFSAWFQHIKDVFAEDPAGGLQTQIDEHIHDDRYYTEEETDELIDSAKGTVFYISVPASGWQGDAAPYTNTVQVEGITEDTILSGVHLAPTLVSNDAAETAYAQWTYLNTMDGSVEFVAEGEKPMSDFAIFAHSTEHIKSDVADAEAIKQQIVASLVRPNAGSHNCIYRGDCLGDHISEEQYAAIRSGTFADLYIGDFWVIDGVDWRIASFDYYLGTGAPACTTHHVVIVPDSNLDYKRMNATNTTVGAYRWSEMYTTNLAETRTRIKNLFGSHVLKHTLFLMNGGQENDLTPGGWFESEVDLLNQQMVYGSACYMQDIKDSDIYTNFRLDKTQLQLFFFNPEKIIYDDTWWLRDVASDTAFVAASYRGAVGTADATFQFGVRPFFCIQG